MGSVEKLAASFYLERFEVRWDRYGPKGRDLAVHFHPVRRNPPTPSSSPFALLSTDRTLHVQPIATEDKSEEVSRGRIPHQSRTPSF